MYNDNSGLCGPPLQSDCLGGIAPKQQGYVGHKETADVPEPIYILLSWARVRIHCWSMGGLLHHTLQEDMEDCIFPSF